MNITTIKIATTNDGRGVLVLESESRPATRAELKQIKKGVSEQTRKNLAKMGEFEYRRKICFSDTLKISKEML